LIDTKKEHEKEQEQEEYNQIFQLKNETEELGEELKQEIEEAVDNFIYPPNVQHSSVSDVDIEQIFDTQEPEEVNDDAKHIEKVEAVVSEPEETVEKKDEMKEREGMSNELYKLISQEVSKYEKAAFEN